ncbi:LuxR C-terminal-related transcriptional regulator [Microbacterium sp. NPDC090225]|uniref:LuxR C-terminal-related transcriptional regulator n=1 Tax=Microbacterium sp. NPDC090225 TaxID=3364207 RepID=UPI0037F4641A
MTDDSREPASADVADAWPREERQAVVAQIRAAIDAERWDDFGAIIDDYFFALTAAEPHVLIEAWPRVPREWVAEHPRQLVASAWTHAIWRSADRLEERVERTFTRWVLGQEEPAARDTITLHAMEIRHHLVSGRFVRANDAADDAQRAISAATEERGFDDILGMVLLHVGLARLVVADLGRAAEAFSEAWRWSATGLPHPVAPYLAGYCALAHALAGDNAHAQEWVDRSVVPVETDPHVMTHRLQYAGLLARALLAIGHFDHESAAEILTRVGRGVESGDLWWVESHARARHALLWGDRRAALRDLEHALNSFPSLTPPASLAGALLRADISDLHQSLGNLEAAVHIVEPLSRAQGDPRLAVSAARALMIQGRTHEATEFLEQAHARLGRDASESARWLVLRANLAHLSRASQAARDLLARVRRSIDNTQTYDAAQDAIPGVYQAIVADAPLPGDATARFVPPPMVSLTPREEQVLGLLAAHASVQEIAEALFVSRNTAKTHLRVLYRKLGVSTRAAALDASAHLRRGHRSG